MNARTNITSLRGTLLLLATVSALVLQISGASAALSIEKTLDRSIIESGDNLSIKLNIRNPYDTEVTVMIQDRNIAGSGGLIIDCMERRLDANSDLEINYPAVNFYSVGKFYFDPANMYYINPESGDTDNITSNLAELEVTPTQNPPLGLRESVTQIYECNGIRSHSSYVSASITSTHIQEHAAIEDGGTPPFSGQRFSIESKKAPVNPLENIIFHDIEFLDRHKDVLDQGFVLVGKQIKNIDDSTGTFAFEYQKGNRSILLTGVVDDKKVENVHLLDNISWIKKFVVLSIITVIIFGIVWYFTRVSEFDKSLLKRKKSKH